MASHRPDSEVFYLGSVYELCESSLAEQSSIVPPVLRDVCSPLVSMVLI